jgi:TPR repeat protein
MRFNASKPIYQYDCAYIVAGCVGLYLVMKLILGCWLLVFLCTSVFAQPKAPQTLDEGIKAYQRGDYAVAASILLQYEQRNVEAKWILAAMHAKGKGVELNPQKALELAREVSAEGPHIEAELLIARAYEQGLGVDPNFQRAITWYRKAGVQGDLETQAFLAEIYYKGLGVKRNLREAQIWFHLAAKQGHAASQRYLGMIFEQGEGTQQNLKTAWDWYVKAAHQQDSVAQMALGRFYKQGLVVPRDLDQALVWVKKAAAQGLDEAVAELPKLEARIRCEQSSTTALYGQLLNCTQRSSMQLALKQQGAKVIRELPHSRSDMYKPGPPFQMATELYLQYGIQQEFNFARFVFAGANDTKLIERVYQDLMDTYGPASHQQGFVQHGRVSYEWEQEDGLKLRLYRHWPDTTTFLEFIQSPKNETALARP